MAAKGLECELPPIDSGYRGEIHAILSNVSTETQIIHKDTRVGQLVITPVLIASDVRTPKEDLLKLFASTLGVPIEFLTVPVLSEPREYEAASFWLHELASELD